MISWLVVGQIWQRIWKYVIIVGGVFAALAVAYGKGRKEVRTEVEARVLGRDLENRRVGEAVRADVAVADDAVGQLRAKWSRRS